MGVGSKQLVWGHSLIVMQLHSIKWLKTIGLDAMAMVSIDDDTRNELRRYKAENGDTYSEAVERLLQESGWYNE